MPTRRQSRTPDRHFRADDDLYDPAAAKARREGRSLSWVIRHALRLYLRDELPLPGDDENPPPEGAGSESQG